MFYFIFHLIFIPDHFQNRPVQDLPSRNASLIPVADCFVRTRVPLPVAIDWARAKVSVCNTLGLALER